MLAILYTITQFLLASANPLRRDFDTVTIYGPPPGYKPPGTFYGRAMRTGDGSLLATSEIDDSQEPPWFPIYKSDNNGDSWHPLSNVTDQVNGWGMRYQPFLYQLEEDIGSLRQGTILCAGNSIPQDLSETQIDLYSSTDGGRSWKFLSHIAHGGKAVPDNGLTPVWEPFLMTFESKLVVYYSDQRDLSYGQKLVHQTSTDGVTWGDVIDDVVSSDYSFRPGMPVVTKLPNAQYILTYEFYGAVEAPFAVYFKLSNDPLNFASATGSVLRTSNGYIPIGSPYSVWLPVGGFNGTIVTNAGSSSSVFLNTGLGYGEWIEVNSTAPASYSRSLVSLLSGEEVLIVGAAPATGNASLNSLVATKQTIGGKDGAQ